MNTTKQSREITRECDVAVAVHVCRWPFVGHRPEPNQLPKGKKWKKKKQFFIVAHPGHGMQWHGQGHRIETDGPKRRSAKERCMQVGLIPDSLFPSHYHSAFAIVQRREAGMKAITWAGPFCAHPRARGRSPLRNAEAAETHEAVGNMPGDAKPESQRAVPRTLVRPPRRQADTYALRRQREEKNATWLRRVKRSCG